MKETEQRMEVKEVRNIRKTHGYTGSQARRPYNNNNLQFKGLIKKRVEITAFDLSAARLYLRKNVVWLQAQLHKWIAKTWQKHQSTGSSGEVTQQLAMHIF